jgi:hypothetical protein
VGVKVENFLNAHHSETLKNGVLRRMARRLLTAELKRAIVYFAKVRIEKGGVAHFPHSENSGGANVDTYSAVGAGFPIYMDLSSHLPYLDCPARAVSLTEQAFGIFVTHPVAALRPDAHRLRHPHKDSVCQTKPVEHFLSPSPK